MSENPYDWWLKMRILPHKTACQLKEYEKANKELEETQKTIKDEVPAMRHSSRGIRMVIQSFADRLRRSSNVIIF
jgi:alpha-glucuronidase